MAGAQEEGAQGYSRLRELYVTLMSRSLPKGHSPRLPQDERQKNHGIACLCAQKATCHLREWTKSYLTLLSDSMNLK